MLKAEQGDNMKKSQEFDKKTIVRSVTFVVVFWACVALLFWGLFTLFNAVRIP